MYAYPNPLQPFESYFITTLIFTGTRTRALTVISLPWLRTSAVGVQMLSNNLLDVSPFASRLEGDINDPHAVGEALVWSSSSVWMQ